MVSLSAAERDRIRKARDRHRRAALAFERERDEVARAWQISRRRWHRSRDLYLRIERGALANLLARGEVVTLYPASAGSHQTGERP